MDAVRTSVKVDQPTTAIKMEVSEVPKLLANKSNTEMIKTLQKYGKVTIEPPPDEFKGPDLNQMKRFALNLEIVGGKKTKIEIVDNAIIVNKNIFDRETGLEVSKEQMKDGINYLESKEKLKPAEADQYRKMIDAGKTVDVLKALSSKNLLDEFLNFVRQEIRKGSAGKGAGGDTDAPTAYVQNETLFKQANKDLDMVEEREKKA